MEVESEQTRSNPRGCFDADGNPSPALQRMAEEAWGYAQKLIARAERKYPQLDVAGAAADRIVAMIAGYRSDTGCSLKTWAFHQVIYAIKDTGRREGLMGFRRNRSGESPRILSLEGIRSSYGEFRSAAEHSLLAIRDPEADFESRESVLWLLRDLDVNARIILWESVVEGKTLDEIAPGLGISGSRAGQIRTKALKRVGDKLENMPPVRPSRPRKRRRLPVQWQGHRTPPVLIEYQGHIRSVAEWSRIVGLSRMVIYRRFIKLQWSAERTLTEPTRPYGRAI